MAALLDNIISLRPPGILASLKVNLGVSQSEAAHAEIDSEKTETAMTEFSAESGCHRRDTMVHFLLSTAGLFLLTVVDVKSIKTSLWSACDST